MAACRFEPYQYAELRARRGTESTRPLVLAIVNLSGVDGLHDTNSSSCVTAAFRPGYDLHILAKHGQQAHQTTTGTVREPAEASPLALSVCTLHRTYTTTV